MKRLKRLSALLILAAMVLSLAACGGGTASSETASSSSAAGSGESSSASSAAEGFAPALDTDIQATLTVVGSWGNFEALDQAAVDFKEYYPNVEVVYTKLSDYRSDLANRFATGEEIDLFITDWWDAGYAPCQNIIDNAEDLNEAGIDFSNLRSDMLVTGNVDGKQVLVPIYLQICGYMVNLDLLEKAGVDVPSGRGEVMAACEKLAAAGYEKPIYINSAGYGRAFEGRYMEHRIGGSDEMTALEQTIAEMDELYASGYVNDEGNTLEDGYNAMIMRFFEGDIPMQACYAANFSGTKKREAKSEAFTANPFRYTLIPAVGEDGRGFINQLGTLYMGIYKDTPNRELADEFLRFLLTDKEMAVLQSIKNMPTANVNNGMDCFAYLKAAELYSTADEERITAADEEHTLDTLGSYVPGGDHAAMYEKMAEKMEQFQ